MLLRICLILAILAGVGAIVLNQVKLNPHIQSIIDKRNEETTRADNQTKRANTAEKSLKETKDKLATTEKTLGETKTQLEAANVKATEQEKRANDLQQNLDTTKQALTEAQQQLSQWEGTGTTPAQVKALVSEVKTLRDLATVNEAEKKILSRSNQILSQQLSNLLGGAEAVIDLPPVKGTVLVVDPKWDFVVLDIGEKQNMVAGGVLMISRNNKLVAKVKIMSVQGDRSIANVVPGWKLDEIMEGDDVLN